MGKREPEKLLKKRCESLRSVTSARSAKDTQSERRNSHTDFGSLLLATREIEFSAKKHSHSAMFPSFMCMWLYCFLT